MGCSTITRKVPAKACQISAGVCEFAAQPEATDKSRGPIKLTVSSGNVFNHPYWGPMVFDVSGMTLAKDRITLDYCHWADEVVGYADNIDVSAGQLVVAGELVSVKPDDRAAEILAKGRAGVPYEASIKFDFYNGLKVEEIQNGMSAQVNGRTEPGPLTIIRTCLVRGAAVCPYGADPYTQSEFSAGNDPGEVDVFVTQFTREQAMSKDNPAEKTPDQVRAELVAGNQDYVARFGAEFGAKWGPLGESKPLLDCYVEFVAKLKAEHQAALSAKDTSNAATVTELQSKVAAAEAKATAAEERLTSLSLGEKEPVSGGGTSPQLPTELQASLTPAMAKFVTAQRAAKENHN